MLPFTFICTHFFFRKFAPVWVGLFLTFGPIAHCTSFSYIFVFLRLNFITHQPRSLWTAFWKDVRTRGGGGSRLNFGQGCAAHCFKIAPLARPIFLKMIPLARLISTSKCHELAFSRQNLPNFCILWTKIWKKFGFLYRNYRSLTFLWPKLPKSIPLPRLNGRKLAKSPGGGGTPILDLTGCAAQQGVLLR